MPNVSNETVTNEAKKVNTEPVKEQPKKVKELKARKPKARKVEELIELSVAKLTDKEKEILIKYLKEEVIKATNMAENYKQNCTTAYEKLSRADNEFKAMEDYYKNSLGYINQQMVAFSQAVQRATIGGIN